MADVNVALWVRLNAKPGKEKEVADFLRGGLAIVQEVALRGRPGRGYFRG